MLTKLQENYNKAIDAYVKEFTKQTEIDFDYWCGDVACCGDFYLNFSDIKIIVDNNIPFDTFNDWYWFAVQTELKINLLDYVKFEKQFKEELAEQIDFNKKDLQIKILSEKIKSFEK